MKKKHSLTYNQILLLLAAALLAAVVGSVTLGRYPIALKELGGILASRIWALEPFWTKTQEALLLQHRLPRIVLACMVGGTLACAGAADQGVIQNPMAAPDILGASSGAAFGAALAILLKLSGTWIMGLAFCGSILTVLLVMIVAGKARGKRVLCLILAGIVGSSLISSGTSLIKLVADPEDQLPAITYWLMGSLNGTAPRDVWFALVPMALGLVPLFLLRWRITLLTLGEDAARPMGVTATRLRAAVILCATLITAAAVSVSGVIGWVGLVIPHLTRRMVGNNYRHLIPASTLFGAVFLLLVDDLSRHLFATEIPFGILTSFIGAPFFLYLITREGERL